MPAHYQVRVKDQSGIATLLLDEAGGFRHLGFARHVNAPGVYALEIPYGDGSIVGMFPLDAQIEIWRSWPELGIDWYKEFEVLHRTVVTQQPQSGPEYMRSHGFGYLHLLARKSILYHAGTAGAEKSGAGETVIKNFVKENAGSLATVGNGRLVDGVMPGLSIQTDGALGGSWQGARAYKGLLAAIQEISIGVGVEFDVVGTGAATFEFRTYTPRLGTDRSTIGLNPATGMNGAGNPPVIFDKAAGLIRDVTYSKNRSDEKTIALALGQGEGVDRQIVVLTAAAAADSPWNDVEETTNATGDNTVAALTASAQNVLDTQAVKKKYAFQPIQAGPALYARDYFLGDLVTARIEGDEVALRVVGIQGEYVDQQERLTVEFAEW